MQLAIPDLNAEQILKNQSVHPACRPRIPGPPSAAGVRRHRIDICCDDVGFHLVNSGTFGCVGVMDRVDQVEHIPGAMAVAHFSKRHRGPDRRVRILPPVFPNAWHVPLDVSGIEFRGIKGRIQQSYDFRVAIDQPPIE